MKKHTGKQSVELSIDHCRRIRSPTLKHMSGVFCSTGKFYNQKTSTLTRIRNTVTGSFFNSSTPGLFSSCFILLSQQFINIRSGSRYLTSLPSSYKLYQKILIFQSYFKNIYLAWAKSTSSSSCRRYSSSGSRSLPFTIVPFLEFMSDK